MIFIERKETDPYYNLAAEEVILKNFSGDVVMLWQNTPSVVLGKHQIPVKEVNLPYVFKKNIPLIRRLSGGGTVYHDLGNINFSVITQTGKKENLIDFKKFTAPVIEYLKTLGVEAYLEGRNNLFVGGKKISGNSGHIFKNKVLHHGTILIETDLQELEKVIHPPQVVVKDKSIPSVRKTVVNLSDLTGCTTQDFLKGFGGFLKAYYSVKETVALHREQEASIRKLVDEKYKTARWNFGYSPDFELKHETEDGSICLRVKKGMVQKVKLSGALKKYEPLLLNGLYDMTLLNRVEEEHDRWSLMKLFGFL